jgi:hypothetical protein
MRNILNWQLAAPHREYAMVLAMGLTVAIIWSMNALNNQPKTGHAEDDIEFCCLPHRASEENEVYNDDSREGQSGSIPYNPFSIFFL